MAAERGHRLRERRWLLALFCVANPVYLAYDAIRLHPFSYLVLLGRGLAEAALLGGMAWMSRRHRPGWNPALAQRAACAGAVVGWLLVVEGAGGEQSFYFTLLPAFPLIYAAAFPDDPLGSPLIGALCLGGGLFLLEVHDSSPARAIEWASVSVFLTAAASAGASLAWRRVEWQLALEKGARDAAVHLASSERRRARAERLAMVGQLAAGVAHEINNPLSYVRANLRWVAQDEQRSSPERNEVVTEALNGVDRIAQIVSDLGRFARDIPDEQETTTPGEIVDEALRLASFRVGTRIRLQPRVADALPELRLPRRRLVQALVNLLLNAADAVEGRDAERWIRIEARRSTSQQDMIELEVEDSGHGLDPAARAHLFEPFFTTKGSQGTGLGLAISRENVERCGGSLEFSQPPGGGARFTIIVPAATPARAGASA